VIKILAQYSEDFTTLSGFPSPRPHQRPHVRVRVLGGITFLVASS